MVKFLSLLFTTASLAMAGNVSTNRIWLNGPYGLFPPSQSQYELTVSQIADNYDPTSIYFDLQGQSLILRGVNLDEGSDWYFANLNDSFTAATISQGAFTFFGQTHSVGIGDFYLGVNTGSGFLNGSPRRDVFGWALLRNSADHLQLLGSAVTYDQPGIVIGTTATIPEPASISLLTLAAVATLAIRGRGRSQPTNCLEQKTLGNQQAIRGH